jgi:hypothetical protein
VSIFINDDNFQDVVNESGAAGFLAGALPRETSLGGLACAEVFAEHVPLIPESKWKSRIQYATENGLFIGHRWRSDPQADYQDGFGFCWAYSLSQATMAVRAAMGQPFVQLSPESLAEDVGYRNRGNSLDSSLAYAAKFGIASRATVPQHKISEREWSAQYKEDRKLYLPLEWFDLGGKDVWAETVTALLSGFGCYVGYDWWGHAVLLDMLRINDKGQIPTATAQETTPGYVDRRPCRRWAVLF